MRLLIVEDHEDLARLLCERLVGDGYSVDVAATATAAERVLSTTRYAAIILDLGLPDADGLVVLRGMRERNDPTPVLILTARGALDDRVQGLRGGADDYLAKPFEYEELLARLEALLRRPGVMLGRRLEVGDLVFNTAKRDATVRGKPFILVGRELDVLELLVRQSGQVVTRKHLEDQLFGPEFDPVSNAIEVYVHRLRQKLTREEAGVAIHTVRGIGYLLTDAAA